MNNMQGTHFHNFNNDMYLMVTISKLKTVPKQMQAAAGNIKQPFQLIIR